MERQNSEAQRERQRRRIFEIVEIGAADDLLPLGAGGVLDQQGEHGLTSYPAMESIFSRKMP